MRIGCVIDRDRPDSEVIRDHCTSSNSTANASPPNCCSTAWPNEPPDLHVTHLDADHFNFRYGDIGAAIEKEILHAVTRLTARTVHDR